ncbi:MAG: D-glycero-alpha-D-manno-heptose-1,7-bisphosphate 7-phosphatase [Vulcanimicrobiaceae bacterium]
MSRVRAVLFDRDGTLVEDVPYNGDPNRVRPLRGVREGLAALRARGLRLGVVTNQSGVGRGLISPHDVEAVNARIEELVGGFDGWFVCPLGPDDGCDCRKPAPKLILDAARAFGLDPSETIVVGDNLSDIEAARNAGARAILLDGSLTFEDAVQRVLSGRS